MPLNRTGSHIIRKSHCIRTSEWNWRGSWVKDCRTVGMVGCVREYDIGAAWDCGCAFLWGWAWFWLGLRLSGHVQLAVCWLVLLSVCGFGRYFWGIWLGQLILQSIHVTEKWVAFTLWLFIVFHNTSSLFRDIWQANWFAINSRYPWNRSDTCSCCCCYCCYI